VKAGLVVSIALGVALSGVPARASDMSANSGQYGPLTIIVAGDTVTGTFFDGRGEPSSSGILPFTCIFMLKGQLRGTRARISTWALGDTSTIPGELTLDGGDVSLAFVLPHPGMLPSGPGIASPGCSRRRVTLSIGSRKTRLEGGGELLRLCETEPEVGQASLLIAFDACDLDLRRLPVLQLRHQLDPPHQFHRA
jgi:hypothetical protein